jgi:diguanylate cyclase (GGDEF)-like protein
MKHKFAFLLAEFLYLRIENITNHLEELFTKTGEEAFLFVGKPVNSPQAVQKNENIILNLAKSKQFDGILSFSNSLTPFNGNNILNDYLSTFEKSKMVTIGDSVKGFSSINLDNYHSIQLTVSHLLEHGLKKFAYLSGPLSNHDASERYLGVKDYLKEKNIDLEAFFEGDFSYEFGKKVVNDYFKNNQNLPQAFICANDEMAIGAFFALIAHGIKVPEEVKLVGFDDNDKGKYIEVPLTTINQGFTNMVLEGLNIIKNKTIQDVVLPGQLITRESCGCKSPIKKANEEYFEKKFYIEKFQKLDQSLTDNLRLQAQLSNISSYSQLQSELKLLLEHYQDFEFHICLFKENTKKIENPLDFQFPEYMKCFLSFANGQFCENIEFKTESILPDGIKEKTSTKVFYVYPLRMADISFGYIVCNTSTAKDQRFVSLKDLLNISLNRIEMQREIDSYKLELENLSFKDSLTKSYNHRGFYRFSQPHFNESISKGLRAALIYCDVDHLKLINDTYGHANGDIIIVAASELLNKYFPNEIVARIGGDEFIVFIKDFSLYDYAKMNSELNELMSEKSEELNKEYAFRMSLGFCLYDNSKQYTLEEMIKEADNLLYEARRTSDHYYTSPNITR